VSSGYYDPGRSSGPVEACYPPEGEDVRELREMEIYYVFGDEEICVVLDTYKKDKEVAERIFDKYYDRIEESDLDL